MDMMFLLVLVLLCGLEDSVLCHRGLCAGDRCFALFQDPGDFAGAQKSCKDSGGQLLISDPDHVQRILPISGSFWLQLNRTDRSPEDVCPSVSVSRGRNVSVSWRPCRDPLSGFLCQYALEEPCGVLWAGARAQVKYTSHLDFDVEDSETFPQGTIATATQLGGKYPDSKHVCFSGDWVPAPWSCEVLRGGCDHDCTSTAPTVHRCTCPAGRTLHQNSITCTGDPCREDPCTGEGEECDVTQGGYNCTCKDGFLREEGVCVDVSVCLKCEHLRCDKHNGVYTCVCRDGFRVSPHDPTKCEVICTGRDCPATCVLNDNNLHQCFCPDGYIQDVPDSRNSTPFCTDINECDTEPCEHKCENVYGGYRCLCDDGFTLHDDEYTCVPVEEDQDDGSGSTPPYPPTPAGARPAAVPSYIKTGSVLGITVFMALCGALLYFLIRNAVKRCGTFELSALKPADIDIYYLQQVSTESYKRFSFDRQFRNNS